MSKQNAKVHFIFTQNPRNVDQNVNMQFETAISTNFKRIQWIQMYFCILRREIGIFAQLKCTFAF